MKERVLNHERKIIHANSAGAIYKHINSRLTHKAGIAPLRDASGSLIMDDLDKAELLNAHFVSVGSHDDGIVPALHPVVSDDIHLSSVYFDSAAIHSVITKTKSNCSPGPDGIQCILLKQLIHVLCFPLSILFNLIF